MQIALTKKLAEAMSVKSVPAEETSDPLFLWTANWTKVWSNRRSDDMLVLVNNATRFTVAIYQVKRDRLKNAAEIMIDAIRNTLLSMNLNTEIVDEYMKLAGEIEFVTNHNRKAAAWVNKSGAACAFYVGREYDGIAKMFDDTVGAPINHIPVNCSGNANEGFYPDKSMFEALTKLTSKPTYKYRAFEVLVTLDLNVYKATRRLLVPADIEFARFHKVLQRVFNWENCHLHDFNVLDGKGGQTVARLVMSEESLEYDNKAILEDGHKLSEYFPKYNHMHYTYDMGDSWAHEIELVRIIEEHDKETPFLLEASGQAPPEDVGGVGGFVNFREIMLNSNHPDYAETKEWAGYWLPELWDWEMRPRVVYL